MTTAAAKIRTDLCQGDSGSASGHAIGNVVHDGFCEEHRLLAHNGHLQHVRQQLFSVEDWGCALSATFEHHAV